MEESALVHVTDKLSVKTFGLVIVDVRQVIIGLRVIMLMLRAILNHLTRARGGRPMWSKENPSTQKPFALGC